MLLRGVLRLSFQWSRPYLSVMRAAVTERIAARVKVKTIPTTIPTAKSEWTLNDAIFVVVWALEHSCSGRVPRHVVPEIKLDRCL
jgi:hypothetical protein